RLAAHVDHAVDRGAAAKHAAARVVERPPAQSGLLLGRKAPVGALVAHAIEVADRDVDPEIIVLATRLEQQHARGGIAAEAIGEDEARRPGADDDVIEGADLGGGGGGHGAASLSLRGTMPQQRAAVETLALQIDRASFDCPAVQGAQDEEDGYLGLKRRAV